MVNSDQDDTTLSILLLSFQFLYKEQCVENYVSLSVEITLNEFSNKDTYTSTNNGFNLNK